MPEVTLFDISERHPVPMELICHPEDIQIFGGHYGGKSYYADFAGIAKKYAAKSIVEIGVRYGYSGIAMCLGARAGGVENPRYRGMDACYFSGPQSDPRLKGLLSNAVATEHFQKHADFADWKLFHCNTQVETWPVTGRRHKFDLANVDGDHSDAGCFHDLDGIWWMMRDGGVIIVDDTGMSEVRAAVERFVGLHSHELQWQWYSNERGFAILRKIGKEGTGAG